MDEQAGFRFDPMPQEPDWMSETVGLHLPDGKVAPIPVSVWLTHSDFAHEILTRTQPQVIVEVGVFTGASLLVMRAMADFYRFHTHFFGVDGWDGEQSGTTGWIWDGPGVYQELRKRTRRMVNVTLLKMRSRQAASYFDDYSIDLIHLDGDHREAGIREDLELWQPKLAPGGVMLLHDIGMVTVECQVWKVWRELQRQYPSFADTRAAGLGAYCPRGVHPGLRDLVRPALVV